MIPILGRLRGDIIHDKIDLGHGETQELNEDLLCMAGGRTDSILKDRLYAISELNVPDGWKLNLGCGSDIRPPPDGWTNLDKYPVHDLILEWDIETGYLPFEDDYFDHILAIDFFEHIPHRSPHVDGELLFSIVKDLMRVSKNGTSWLIITPAHPDSLNGAGHCRLVTEGTWAAWMTKASSAERLKAMEDGRLVLEKVINIRQWNFNKFFGRAISKCQYLKVVK